MACPSAGIPILAFNGDTDSYIPVVGTRSWVESLAIPLKDPARRIRAWSDKVFGQIGGHMVEYQRNLTWATVQGAGHATAKFAPAKVQQLVLGFVQGRLSEL